jgi:hypothetical protein
MIPPEVAGIAPSSKPKAKSIEGQNNLTDARRNHQKAVTALI